MITILGSLRILLVMALAASSALATTNSSCNDILSGLPAEVRSAIHDLAKLRFDLDQRIIAGLDDSVTRAMKSQYLNKEEEVLAASSLDRGTLVTWIQSEIEALQHETSKRQVERTQRKEIERQQIILGEIILPGSYWRHAQSLLSDGRLMITGGNGDSNTRNGISIIDLTTRTVKELSKLKEERSDHGQSTVGNHVFIVGGSTNPKCLDLIERIDPKTGQSSVIGHLKEARSGHTQDVLSDGSILIAAGRNDHELKSIERIDPQTGESEIIGNLKFARHGHTQSVLPDGSIMFVGGYSGTLISAIETFNPKNRQTNEIGHLKEPRHRHSQSVLPDGRVLIVGGIGRTSKGYVMLDSIELIDPKTGESKVIGHLKTARAEHTQHLLPDGRVMIIAGRDEGSNALSSIEIIDPNTGDARHWDDLDQARTEHRQTVLPDGSLVIIGGYGKERILLVEELFVGTK